MSKKILFQGDSITDVGRFSDQNFGFGNGYPLLIKSSLGYDCPGDYEFFNRGISGNRIVDVYARIKDDFINIQPDYASIYIGVNDAWHEILWQNGVDTKKFKNVYKMLLDEVLAACPNIKLILIAPFVLEGTATCNTEEIPNRLARFIVDVDEKAQAVKELSEEYNLPLIELQPAFNKALEQAPAEYWTGDGVHPTPHGHEIIKRLWLETFAKIK